MMRHSPFPHLFLAGICALGLIGCLYSDEISRSYATLADAREDIEKGWIPPCLPPSTHHISDSHNLDTNIGEGSFRFTPGDLASFQACTPANDADLAGGYPDSREGQSLKAAGYQFLKIPEFTLAIHPSGKGRYWLKVETFKKTP